MHIYIGIKRALALVLIVVFAFGSFFSGTQNAQAAVYTKTWTSQGDFENNLSTTKTPTTIATDKLNYTYVGNIASPEANISLKTWQSNFSETFDTNTYNDMPRTTATWDTANGRVVVPAAQSVTSDALDLKLGGVYGGSEIVQTNVTVGNVTYMGLNNGKLLAFDASTDTTSDLTNKIAYWGANTFNKFVYDADRNEVFFVGPGARFGRITVTVPPENGTAEELSGRLTSVGCYSAINSIDYDTDNRMLYLGGDGGWFMRYNPASTAPATDLRSQMPFWLTYAINSVEYGDGNVYINGQWGFAVYSIASNSVMSLNDKVAAFAGGSATNNNAVIAVGQDIYIGSDEGTFLKYNNTTGSVENLTQNIRANFSTNAIRKFAYDSVNGDLYIGGDGGKLVCFDIASRTVVADFSSIVMLNYIPVTALVFSQSTNEVYVGGAYSSRFAKIRAGTNTFDDLSTMLSQSGGTAVNGLDVASGRVYIAAAGNYALYYDIAGNRMYSITEKMNEFFGANYGSTTTEVVAGDTVYQGTSNGRLFAYDTTTGINTEITSRIPLWGGYPIQSMLNVNGIIYIGSYYGKFARFNSANSSVGEDLSNAVRPITEGWRYVYELAYDSAQGEIYLAGPYAFGSYRVSDGRVTNRRTGLDAIWGNSYFNTGGLAYNPSDNKIYLGSGDWGGRYFMYDMNFSTPTPSAQFTEITSALTNSGWGGYPIYDMAYSASADAVVLGGQYGRAAVHPTGATTATNLNFISQPDWGGNTVLDIFPDGDDIYFAGTGGRFSRVTRNGTAWDYTPLYTRISSTWTSPWNVNAVSGKIGNEIFLAGDTGRFARYDVTGTGNAQSLVNTYSRFYSCVESFTSVKSDNAGGVYFGTGSGKLAYVDNASNAFNVSASVPPTWSNYPIYSMAYSVPQQTLYLTSYGGKIGRITNTTTSDEISSSVVSFWSGNAFNSVTILPGGAQDDFVYLAGATGRFGYIQSHSDSGLTFTGNNLSDRISKYLRIASPFYEAEYVSQAPSALYLAANSIIKYDITGAVASALTSVNSYMSGQVRALHFNNSQATPYIYAGSNGRLARFEHNGPAVQDLTSSISSFWRSFAIYDISGTGTNIFLSGERTRIGILNASTVVFEGKMYYLGGYISFYGNVYSIAYDRDADRVYIGVDGGRLGRLNPQTNEQVEDLTSKISSFWGENAIRNLTYISSRRELYLGGDNATFAKIDTTTTTATSLSGAIQAQGWVASVPVNDIVYVASGDSVYLVGAYSHLGAFNLSTTAFSLYRTQVAGQFGYYATLYAGAYESNANAIYFGGYYAFGRFNISTETVNYLWNAISYFFYYNMYDIAVSDYSHDVYFAGYYGLLGKYTPLAAGVNLSDTFRAANGYNEIRTLSYDASQKAMYYGGQGGAFGKIDTISDVVISFSSYLSFGNRYVYAVEYVPSINRVYVGGENLLKRITTTITYHAHSRTLNPFPFPIGWATVTASYNPGPGGIVVFQLSNNGGSTWQTMQLGAQKTFAVAGQDLVLRIVLDMNPEVYDVSINYGGYYAQGVISGLKINAASPTTWQTVRWNATLNGESIKARTRTAGSQAGLTTAEWSPYYLSSPAAITSPSGVWLELEMELDSDGRNTPVLNDFSITFDSVESPPLVEIATPAANPYTTARSTLAFAGTSVHASGIQSVRYSNMTTGATGNATGMEDWTIPAVPLEVGSNTVRVTARSNSGSEGYSELSVNRLPPDTTAPIVTINQPTVNPIYATASATLALMGTATDDRGIVSMSWQNADTGVTGSVDISLWKTTPISLLEGDNNITVRAFDEEGNEGNDAVVVTYVPGGIGTDVVNVRYVPGYWNNINGYAWSPNIGWISFNCLNGGADGSSVCKDTPYGVNVQAHPTDVTRAVLKGFAWSGDTKGVTPPPANIGPNSQDPIGPSPAGLGWLRFDIAGNANRFPQSPGNQRASAFIDLSTSQKELRGWAQWCSARSSDTSCAGGTPGNDDSLLAGKWDGWLQLSGRTPDYGVRLIDDGKDCKLAGWAWGSSDTYNSAYPLKNKNVGWVSMNCENGMNGEPDDQVNCQTSNYGLTIDTNKINFTSAPSNLSSALDAVYKLTPQEEVFDLNWEFNGICQDHRGFEIQVSSDPAFGGSFMSDAGCPANVALCCSEGSYCSPGTASKVSYAPLSLNNMPAGWFGSTVYWRVRVKAAPKNSGLQTYIFSPWSQSSSLVVPPDMFPTNIDVEIIPKNPSIGQTVSFVNLARCYSRKSPAACTNYTWNFESTCAPQPSITNLTTTDRNITNIFNARCTTYGWMMPTGPDNVCSATGDWQCPERTNIEMGTSGGNRKTILGENILKVIPEWKEVVPNQ